MTESEADDRAVPLLSVVHGEPTPAELAALLVVLASRAAPAASRRGERPARSRWSAPARLLRAPVTRGPGAWRGSALPG